MLIVVLLQHHTFTLFSFKINRYI